MKITNWTLLFLTSSLLLGACGGGGSANDPEPPPTGDGGPTYTAGVYEDADLFKNRCESPRTFTDIDGNPYPDIQGSTLHENHFLRSWSNDTYLWYDELPDIDPGTYNDPLAYFALLKTNRNTSSGTPVDQFHFTYDTSEYELLTQAGVSVSYGIDWELTSPTVPRELYIRYIEPGSPADAASLNLTRGVKVIEIDGVSVEYGNTQSDVDKLNAGLYPSAEGETHTFTIQDLGSSTTREVTLSATEVTSDPVPITGIVSTGSGNVGYIFFKRHNYVAEDRLYDAMTDMAANNVTDLVVDVRYNGGGFLYIASQLAYMIAGSAATNGKTFEQLRFNDKYPDTNPITGNTLSPTPFYSTTSQYSDTYGSGQPLPQLSLERVFILSTDSTCSASEAIINGLRGVDIEVILIGTTTCGKPYGFYATDNCGTTYFTIQFDGVNHKGQGGYSDGFTPMNDPVGAGVLQNGCYVEDDLSYALGASNEPLFAAALQYRLDSSCPAITKSTLLPLKGALEGLGNRQRQIMEVKDYQDPFKKQQ